MINFTQWMQNLYEGFPTHRGGKGKDWVSEDDYDPRTPADPGEPDGGQHLNNPHRHAGYKARAKGLARTANPHHISSKEHAHWHSGWDDHHYIHEPKNHGYGASDE